MVLLSVLLELLGPVIIVIGLIALIPGHLRPLRIYSRRSAGVAIGAGAVLLIVGAAIAPMPLCAPQATDTAPCAAPTRTPASIPPTTAPSTDTRLEALVSATGTHFARLSIYSARRETTHALSARHLAATRWDVAGW
ncbi:MAG: hypothetical protein M1118_10955 [Chloroflexi bacterium]|nr:hypothetical protein [Chloroflexota bacterium]